jgi:hypothetical protein
MRHQFSNKNLFQITLFTLFSSLLFVGIIGVTSAQAEVLTGTAKGKVYCDESFGAAASLVKDKFKESISIDITFNPGDPDFIGTFNIITVGVTLPGEGIGLGKNSRKGSFSFVGTDGFTSTSVTGNYVLDKPGTTLIKVSGKMVVHDFMIPGFGSPCFAIGSFKAKNLNP